jgi:hypothetical protein
MKINLSLVCKTYAINPENDAISFLEVIERINSYEVPFVMWPFYVIFGCEQEEGDLEQSKTMFQLHNNGKLIGQQESTIDFSRGPKTRLITHIPNLTIPEPGSLVFSIAYREKIIGSAPLTVIKMEAPQPIVAPTS